MSALKAGRGKTLDGRFRECPMVILDCYDSGKETGTVSVKTLW